MYKFSAMIVFMDAIMKKASADFDMIAEEKKQMEKGKKNRIHCI